MPEAKLKIVATEEPVSKVIATGLTLVVGISNDRQIQFQSGYEGDEDDSSIKARLARMNGFADYLKATARIPDIGKELRDLRKKRATYQELYDRLEKEHPHQIAAREVEIEEMERLRPEERAKKLASMDVEVLKLQDLKAERTNAAIEAHRRSGRQGSWVARGADKAGLDVVEKAIERLQEARDADMVKWDAEYDSLIAKARADLHAKDEERKQAMEGHRITLGRHDEEIAALEAELEECRELIAA